MSESDVTKAVAKIREDRAVLQAEWHAATEQFVTRDMDFERQLAAVRAACDHARRKPGDYCPTCGGL